MKIYDCFTYCGEDRLLEIRFKTLYNKVDKFVIIEGNKFFNGNIKKKKFDINKFNEFKSKINYFYIEDFPEHDGNNWNYEYFQRNKISLGLAGLNDNDIILISDADEIPNLNNEIFLQYDSAVFLQKMFYYKLNIFCYDGLKWNKKWPGTKSCKFKFFKNAQSVREFRVKNYPWWRFDRKIKRYIEPNGGWHFAYLMNTEDISKKISGFAHEVSHVLNSESFNIEALSDQNYINKKIENMDDIYGRKNIKLKVVDIDTSFPKEIFENVYKYQDLIRQKVI
jgi:beta-1,4-mannosyl-glycoprotein beta-1,4-N-acetylglucosaminyltransferase